MASYQSHHSHIWQHHWVVRDGRWHLLAKLFPPGLLTSAQNAHSCKASTEYLTSEFTDLGSVSRPRDSRYQGHTLTEGRMCVSRLVMSDSLGHHGLWLTWLLCPWNSSGKNTGVGCYCLLQGDLSNPGIEPRSPRLQADSLPAEPPGKSIREIRKT